jgi:hypothetical protein
VHTTYQQVALVALAQDWVDLGRRKRGGNPVFSYAHPNGFISSVTLGELSVGDSAGLIFMKRCQVK